MYCGGAACLCYAGLCFHYYPFDHFLYIYFSLLGYEDSAYVCSNTNASDSEDETDYKDQNLMDSSYQCLKWQTHCPENFYRLAGANGEDV